MTTYRAAYFVPSDRQGSVVLTLPEDAAKADAELMALAEAEADENLGDWRSRGEIVVGDWQE